MSFRSHQAKLAARPAWIRAGCALGRFALGILKGMGQVLRLLLWPEDSEEDGVCRGYRRFEGNHVR